MKSWWLSFIVLVFITSPLKAQHILQGQLFDASEVEFELINGFAFQNSILIRLNHEPYGHFNGPVGIRAQKLQSMIDELNLAKKSGGKFYLPTGSRFQKGSPVVQSIIHFPVDEEKINQHEISKQCAPLLKEHQSRINQVFIELEEQSQWQERQARSPASIEP